MPHVSPYSSDAEDDKHNTVALGVDKDVSDNEETEEDESEGKENGIIYYNESDDDKSDDDDEA